MLASFRSAIAALLLVFIPAVASNAGDPAVSGVNGKISSFGGIVKDENIRDGVGGVAGSLTLPILHSYGLQIDGAYADVGGDTFLSTGAHLFWRDPNIGLLGLYGGFARLNAIGGMDIARLGGEAQYFAGNVTLDSALGYRFGDAKEGTYGRARVQYYTTDNLMFSGGYVYEGMGFGFVGTEYQVYADRSMGVSLFAEANINDKDNYSVLGGVRVFLGESMSLINRHRRQDPDSYSGNDMQATQQAVKLNQSRPQISCPFSPAIKKCTRYEQCTGAGYTTGPGSNAPASCDCATTDVSWCA